MVQNLVELVNKTRRLGDLDFILGSNTAFLWTIEPIIWGFAIWFLIDLEETLWYLMGVITRLKLSQIFSVIITKGGTSEWLMYHIFTSRKTVVLLVFHLLNNLEEIRGVGQELGRVHW